MNDPNASITLSENNEEVLENYVYGVIDLTWDGTNVTYSTTNGLDVNWFTIASVTSASVEGEVLAVSLTLNVSEDNGAVATLLTGSSHVPVLVRSADAVKAASVTATTLENGVLTVTFQVNVA